MKDHEREIGFRYNILRWISNWKRIVLILINMLGRLLLFVSDGNWVEHRLLVRFTYDGSYHLN